MKVIFLNDCTKGLGRCKINVSVHGGKAAVTAKLPFNFPVSVLIILRSVKISFNILMCRVAVSNITSRCWFSPHACLYNLKTWHQTSLCDSDYSWRRMTVEIQMFPLSLFTYFVSLCPSPQCCSPAPEWKLWLPCSGGGIHSEHSHHPSYVNGLPHLLFAWLYQERREEKRGEVREKGNNTLMILYWSWSVTDPE